MKFNAVITHVDCITNFKRIPVLLRGSYRIIPFNEFTSQIVGPVPIDTIYYSYNQELTSQQFVNSYA